MKKIIHTLVVAALLGCGQTDDSLTPNVTGEVEYNLNGESMKTVNVIFQLDGSPAAQTCCTGSYLLTVKNYENKWATQSATFESFNINNITLEPGKRQLGVIGPDSETSAGVAFFSMIADDVLAATYKMNPDELEDNWFEIEEINADSNEAKGRFALSMVMTLETERNALPDTVRITDGVFRATIKN